MCPFFENSNVFRARFKGSSHCIFLLGNCCGLFKYHALSIVKLNLNFKPAGKIWPPIAPSGRSDPVPLLTLNLI